MYLKKNKLVLLLLFFFCISNFAKAQHIETEEEKGLKSLDLGIEYLQQYFEKTRTGMLWIRKQEKQCWD